MRVPQSRSLTCSLRRRHRGTKLNPDTAAGAKINSVETGTAVKKVQKGKPFPKPFCPV